jgi:hypothetical protein
MTRKVSRICIEGQSQNGEIDELKGNTVPHWFCYRFKVTTTWKAGHTFQDVAWTFLLTKSVESYM